MCKHVCNKDVNHFKDDTSLVNAKETIINIVSKHLQVVYPHVTSDSFQSNNKAHASDAIAAVPKRSFKLFIVDYVFGNYFRNANKQLAICVFHITKI